MDNKLNNRRGKTERTEGERFTVIGLCGRSGAGKTTVCEAFRKYGFAPIDTDRVYRDLTAPLSGGEPSALVTEIARSFGGDVVAPDGSLDRKALAAAVFGEGNSERLKLLNSLTHKPILERTEEMIADYKSEGARGVIVDAPALFESGFHTECDAVICVSAPDEVLIGRITERDRISREAAERRLSSQTDDGELRRRSDYVIENDGNTDLAEAAMAAIAKILE